MKGAIFDVDGTILDSMGVWFKVTERFFDAHGLPFTQELADEYKDMTLEESLPNIRTLFGLDMTFEEIFEEFRVMVAEEYRDNIELKKGADRYIKRLHEGGVRIAVATSGYENMCKSAFRRLGILDYIDEYAFSSEVGTNKGSPAIYRLAAERLGVDAGECVVFEDIVKGIASAGKAGFKTCAVYDETNINETEELKRLADRYIVSWEELL